MRGLIATALAIGVGCGGASSSGSGAAPSSGEPEKREVATGNTLTDYQKRRLLGHYSTEDGASGFILDRTVTPWKAKLDGTDNTVTLTESHGPRDTMEYRGQGIWIRVDKESGDVQLFQGPKQTQGVRVVRDADANQLK